MEQIIKEPKHIFKLINNKKCFHEYLKKKFKIQKTG